LSEVVRLIIPKKIADPIKPCFAGASSSNYRADTCCIAHRGIACRIVAETWGRKSLPGIIDRGIWISQSFPARSALCLGTCKYIIKAGSMKIEPALYKNIIFTDLLAAIITW